MGGEGGGMGGKDRKGYRKGKRHFFYFLFQTLLLFHLISVDTKHLTSAMKMYMYKQRIKRICIWHISISRLIGGAQLQCLRVIP